MATMKCPYCDQEISDKVENCNHCGANTEPTNHEVSGSLKQKLRSNSEEECGTGSTELPEFYEFLQEGIDRTIIIAMGRRIFCCRCDFCG